MHKLHGFRCWLHVPAHTNVPFLVNMYDDVAKILIFLKLESQLQCSSLVNTYSRRIRVCRTTACRKHTSLYAVRVVHGAAVHHTITHAITNRPTLSFCRVLRFPFL